jgi:hypothetical protein
MFRETDKKFQETDRKFQETDMKFQETDKKFQETDKKIKEAADERRKMVQTVRETGRFVREVSGELRAIGQRMDKSKRDLDKRMGDLGSRFGELAEHLVAPSINEKFNILGYQFDAISPGGLRIEVPVTGLTLAEIDLLLQNTESMVAVEVKAKLLEKDIDEHGKRLEVLRLWADRHKDGRRIHGAVAGAIVSPSVRARALKAGLYVIVQTGDTVKIDVPTGFIPRRW